LRAGCKWRTGDPDGGQLEPDVVILNINMPVLNGLAAAREINIRLPDSAIVTLSSEADKH
jgi:YesN/AraC family two-component response regulator